MLLISPTAFEASFLLEHGQAFSFLGKQARRGKGWVWLEGGIGKVNTAITLTHWLANQPTQQVLLFGIAGAYPSSGCTVGQVYCAHTEIQADIGLQQGGLEAMGFEAFEGYHNHYPLHPWDSVPAVSMLTRDQVSETPEQAHTLEQQWSAQLENMEGAAFAQCCLRLGVQGSELRAVSNIAGIRNKAHWDIKGAIQALSTPVLEAIL